MNLVWNFLPPPDAQALEGMGKRLGIDSYSAALFVLRGLTSYEEAERFCTPLNQSTHDPLLMAGMAEAKSRVLKAISAGETVMIYGDYDVDGTTSVAMMYEFLSDKIEHLHAYIPDRYFEGYGISAQGVEKARELGCALIIALDCGIKSIDRVEQARDCGIDFIICDHHKPGSELPRAIAVLDPLRSDCGYPYKGLSGCGVGFKLVEALAAELSSDPRQIERLTDLVAVSIAADIVPMTGENRVLASRGLEVLNQRTRPGLSALMKAAGGGVYGIDEVVFRLGPRINAAGRMRHGLYAVELLTAKTEAEATELAISLENDNRHRKEADDQTRIEALKQLEGSEGRYSSVVFAPHWKKGVIGIAASRLVEQYYRPTVVFTGEGGVLSGSARSVQGFNLYEAIEACSEHLIQYGGHAFAAGMTIEAGKLRAFSQAFEQAVAERILPEQRIPGLSIDLELPIERVDGSYASLIKRFAPYGPQNPKPVFVSRNLSHIDARRIGADASHLKVVFPGEPGRPIEGVFFKKAAEALELLESGAVDIAYHIDINEWQGRKSVQLMILDMKSSERAQNGRPLQASGSEAKGPSATSS